MDTSDAPFPSWTLAMDGVGFCFECSSQPPRSVWFSRWPFPCWLLRGRGLPVEPRGCSSEGSCTPCYGS